MGEMTWRRLFKRMARNSLVLLLGLALGGGGGFAALKFIPAQFSAQMVVGPVAGQSLSGMGARVAGASVSRTMAEAGQESPLADFDRYQELVRGLPAATALLADSSLAPALPPEERADPARLSRWLKTHLYVEPVGATPMRRLVFRSTDRSVALAVLKGAHEAADAALRDEARRRVDAQISFVRARLSEETLTESRAALAAMLAEQTRLRALVDVDLPFAADVVEPPSAPQKPDWPPAPLVLALGLALGLGTAFCFIWIRTEQS